MSGGLLGVGVFVRLEIDEIYLESTLILASKSSMSKFDTWGWDSPKQATSA